ncbi:hypothetical protein BJV74DRAFT_884972 [Russula compacta]|nr:hypothetical protein BJV74DRAFT_884972 [Russula compacta]
MPFRQAASKYSVQYCEYHAPNSHTDISAGIEPGIAEVPKKAIYFVSAHHVRNESSTVPPNPSTILGRAIKTEYLALGTLLGTVGLSYAAASGGSKEASSPSKPTLQEVKDSVKFDSSSREEEELIESIKKFVAEAEKGSKH